MASAVELLDQAIAKVDALISVSQPAAAPPASIPATAQAPQSSPSASTTTAVPAPAPQSSPPAASLQATNQAHADTTLFYKASLKVARILTVSELPNSEKLFKLSIDVGNVGIKQVCAGLKPYIPKAQLEGSLVVVVLNLKPAKLAGELSEAMILAADALDAAGTRIVCTLVPPPNSEPGDAVYLSGGAASETAAKVVKSDEWQKIVAALSVQDSKAVFSGASLVTSRGAITLPASIPDGSGIH